MDPMQLCPGKGLVLPNKLNINQIATNVRFLLILLQNVKMSKKSPFAIHKALIGIGGEPKSVKHLRSEDLLIETLSALQIKSFLLTNTFLDSHITISPHKSLNTSHSVFSKPDLLSTPESEILEGFSDKGVIQARRITIKKDATIIPTKHVIVTFNSPKLPSTIKAGYLNCKICPYITNLLRCFNCQRFGHWQTSCHGHLTCSRCASVGHPFTDSSLEPKYENITKLKCPSLKLLQSLSSLFKSNTLISTPDIFKSSSSTQAQLLPSTSSIAAAVSQPQPPTPVSDAVVSATCNNPIEPSSSIISASPFNSDVQIPKNVKQISKNRRKCTKVQKPEIEIKMAPHKPRKSATIEYTTDDKDMIVYDV
ncbi:uncharacterized protein TNCV_560801 [Trichonephila clavipes]|nr:uncharacterized protein TNCV_560801 [Trichonephila clavipes]